MPARPSSHPCLPKELIDQFKSDPQWKNSFVFTEEFESFRVKALDRTLDERPFEVEVTSSNCNVPDHYSDLAKNLEKFRPGDKKTYLHKAVKDGDVPLAYEMIRMGILINAVDSDRVTPLFFACSYLRFLHTLYQSLTKPTSSALQSTRKATTNPDSIKTRMNHVAKIATILVEQGAYLDVVALRARSLPLAVQAQQWDLVRLFLVHGVRRPTVEETKRLLPSIADRIRLAHMMNEVKAADPRPSRPCPCWSGKLLTECHDTRARLPYPTHFLCVCGRHRPYGSCCLKRNIMVEESWHSEHKNIIPVTIPFRNNLSAEVPPELRHHFDVGFNDLRRFQEALLIDPALLQGQIVPQSIKNWGTMLLCMLPVIGREDAALDPAFIFALDNVDFVPRPYQRQLTKQEEQRHMQEWNAAIDRYIETSSDSRSRTEIEIATKIASHGGPLFRRCEADGCEKVEGRDIEKMQKCSQCGLIFYCSRECQRSSWKVHKAECKSKTHRMQELPTQTVMEQVVMELGVWKGRRLENGISRPSPDVRSVYPKEFLAQFFD
ncbi:hypothetical protein VKT23_007462 [Stygiomarasmius scandens]|uniref:MYND-type domain-containing protein n=1 Tax=Marasmiellus scandens TaxID=2682957 RepID=A0ABR1JJY8_9AGAR